MVAYATVDVEKLLRGSDAIDELRKRINCFFRIVHHVVAHANPSEKFEVRLGMVRDVQFHIQFSKNKAVFTVVRNESSSIGDSQKNSYQLPGDTIPLEYVGPLYEKLPFLLTKVAGISELASNRIAEFQNAPSFFVAMAVGAVVAE